MTKTILIIGANGILAKRLIRKFHENENYIIIASTRNIENISEKLDGVGYINNVDLIKTDILKNIDLIINTAFPRTQETKTLSSAKDFFTSLVIKSIDSNVKAFINISSQSVYGSYREIPSYENDNFLNPEDMYAFTKSCFETIGWALTKNSEMKYTNIRLASLIGKEYPERVINKMINFAFKNKKIVVQNDKNVFGFMDIDDAIEGLYNFVKNSNIDDWKPIYNFGTIPKYNENLGYIAKTIKKILKERNIEIEVEINKQQKADKLQAMNSDWFYQDSQWQPKILLEDSIKKIIEELWN